ncbi:MAG TPA: DUF502 domain-containing protein [Dissulfurispiraceae bacterium]|nr:DUF502 domain-containing protein [Dissulfurispiraceae bacterium]
MTSMFEPIRITFKRKFLAGLVITVPVTLTAVVIATLFKFIDGILGQFFDIFLGRHIAGLGFIAAVGIIFLVGIISTNVFGKRVLGVVEYVFLNIPVFKSIYTSIKQLVDAFSPDGKGAFSKFVIAEYPRIGCYSFGFLTKECSIRSSNGETKLKAVYIPTNNLYMGEIILLDDKSIIYTNIPIEEGIRIVLSGGIAAPTSITAAREVA